MKIGEYLQQGWVVVKENFGTLWLGTFLLMLVNSVVAVLTGPMMCSNAYATLRALDRQPLELGDVMSKGFERPLDYILGGLVVAILSALSALCLVIPMFFVVPMLWYTFPAMVDRKCGFVEGMKASKEIWSRDVIGHVLFLLAIIAVNLVATLLCVLPVLVSSVVSYCAITVAYHELSGRAARTQPAAAQA